MEDIRTKVQTSTIITDFQRKVYLELQRQAAALLKGETDLTHLESLVRLLP